MKGILALALAILLMASVFIACDSVDGSQAGMQDENGSAQAPYIGENGNWWVGNNDLGVSAKGEKGDKGDNGVTPQLRILL